MAPALRDSEDDTDLALASHGDSERRLKRGKVLRPFVTVVGTPSPYSPRRVRVTRAARTCLECRQEGGKRSSWPIDSDGVLSACVGQRHKVVSPDHLPLPLRLRISKIQCIKRPSAARELLLIHDSKIRDEISKLFQCFDPPPCEVLGALS